MNNEPKEIALRYKGEDYKDCKKQLMADGFQSKGYNMWYSSITGNTYRFVLADGGAGYVIRVEQVTEKGLQLINTEFCDQGAAISRYDAEHARPTSVTLDGALQRFKDSLFTTSLSKVLRLVEAEKESGSSDAAWLFEQIDNDGKGKLVIKNYLFCKGIVCFYSPVRRSTHELVDTLEYNGKKLYLYRARIYTEDLLESLVSKVKLVRILGEEYVKRISEEAV